MGHIIKLHDKLETPPDNLITLEPWEFRRADWENAHFIQMLRSQSEKLERHRKEVYQEKNKAIRHLPPHFILRGGMAYTIRGLYMNRNNEGSMREVYYLAGLIDCMINQISPLLRTDLIRDMYKKIMELKNVFNLNWYGQIDHVLFPIDGHLYNLPEYRQTLSKARTMKALYFFIREGTDEMFDIFSLEYTFYTPGRRS